LPLLDTFPSSLHHKHMPIRFFAILILLSSSAFAGMVEDVRTALAHNNFTLAESELRNYRDHEGVTPEYIEALSWVARASFSANALDQAETYAKQSETLAREQLKHRALDAEPHLPQALGAALEVEAQVLDARGQQQQAVALLQRSLVTYRATSIRARLQKNLNLLALSGKPAPPLSTTEYLGPRPVPLIQLTGSPVLLFFWAHWCGDCKYEGPIISRLSSEFGANGLKIEAPTQLYGYAAGGEDAKPKAEFDYIRQVWQHYYPGLQSVPVPVSTANFNAYGASTTPTLVLVDRKGRVVLYHPGLMQYDDLRASIEKALTR